jgi:RNA polymerase sigma factor (sigma-70 family)
MSPASLRRYRAERLLRLEFESLRGRVIAAVRGRLRAGGSVLDESDLEACYAQAWQGLYAAVAEGQEIANPTGWLALVTYRRAIEEQRSRRRIRCCEEPATAPVGPAARRGRPAPAGAIEDRDLAAELDDRVRLRQLFEALRARLSTRELQAAALCYLHGLSRAEAAARLGVSESRMRKLMEGTGGPGVSGKVGALLETITSGRWCEEQGSLMRGFAYGILDPEGERYQLALIHAGECPACRAYVASLRGLAAVLPPLPALLRLALGGGAAAAPGLTAAPGPGACGGVGGALPASGAAGAAGAGAAGGSWALAGGPVGAKLAVGCLLAIGLGAGCVALGTRPAGVHPPGHHARARRGAVARAAAPPDTVVARARDLASGPPSRRPRQAGAGPSASAPSSPASMASREFGPEQAAVSSSAAPVETSSPRARAASTGGEGTVEGEFGTAGSPSSAQGPAGRQGSPGQTSPSRGSASQASASGAGVGPSGSAAAAQREFAPG